jgi:hypothetical protein
MMIIVEVVQNALKSVKNFVKKISNKLLNFGVKYCIINLICRMIFGACPSKKKET